MDYRDLNPYIRYAMLTRRSVSYDEALYAYDHRLFYVMDGVCQVFTEGQSLSLQKNDLLVLPPQTGYRLLFQPGAPCLFALLNFDLDSSYYATSCRAPDVLRDFDPQKRFSTRTMPPFDGIFLLKGATSLQERLAAICAEMQEEEPLCRDMLSAELKAVLLLAIRAQNADAPAGTQSLNDVRAYVDAHCMESLTNARIAAKFGYHPYYLSRIFAARFGQTLHTYVGLRRLKHARQLLLSTDKSIAEIARESGFRGTSWFSEYFKTNVGLSPTQYRRKGK